MKKISEILILLVIFTITSCKKEATLQTYLIAKQENPKFITLDFSTSVFPFTVKENASEADKNAYKSIRKINVSFLPKNKASNAEIKAEKEMLTRILNTSDYKTLMKFKKNGVNIKIYYKGEPETIDEMIVSGYSKEMGVGVARLLGDHMNPTALMNMTNNIDVNANSFKKIKDVFDKEAKQPSEKQK